MKPQQNYHHGNLRLALVDETARMITESSVEDVTMRTLSQRVGVSRSAPYRHFEDKSALLCAVAEEGFRRFQSKLKQGRMDQSINPLERLEQMGQIYVQFAFENPAYYRMMFQNVAVAENRTPALEAVSGETFNQLIAVLQDCQQAGLIIEENVTQQAAYVWSLIHGMVTLLLDQRLQWKLPDYDDQQIAEVVLNRLTQALRKSI